MAPPHSLEVTQQAMLIFTIIQAFIRNGGDNRRQRHAKLESLPQEFESIPFRQVYRLPPGSHNLACPHWEASELSFSGAGNLWCFTQLLRSGRNITRKTEDGQTWESRNGRERKNGYPTEIFVNRLVLSGQPFDMIELTLDERVVPCTDLPTVALCQIRWTQPGNNVAASSQQDSSNVNISDTATSMEGEGAGGQEETTEMEIDPPPPVEAPHAVGPPQDSSNVNVVRLGASTSQEGEEANQEGTMDFQLVEPPPPGDVSDWRKDYLKCKEAVSFLHRMMAKLEMICCYSCEAHRITSLVQSAASIVRDEANRLEIVLEEPEGTRLDTFSSTQQHDFAAARDSNFPEVEDQRLQPHRHTGTEPGIFEDDCVDVSEDYFLNLGGGGAA